MTRLTKSKYVTYVRCPKALWLSENEPEIAVEDPQAESRIETGKRVGELAKGLLGPYTDISIRKEDGTLDIQKMNVKTLDCIVRGDRVLAEASFSSGDNLYCAVDLLENTERGFNIYEVKSSTGETPEDYYDDIAYQKYVMESGCLHVEKTYLVFVNSDYVLDGELDIHKFFKIIDVTEDINEAYSAVKENVIKAQNVLKSRHEPIMDLSKDRCKGVGDCPFWKYCTKHVPETSVFDLYRMQFKKKLDYYFRGVISFEQLQGEGINEMQKIQVDCTLNNENHVDPYEIRDFMRNLSYPLYFLDFETMQLAIPEYQGTRPYQQLPFQYSLHYIEHEGGPLLHKEFLGISGEDPRRACAEQLCKDIPLDVCTTAYNKAFECTRLKELAEDFPDLADHLLNIRDHIVDLLTPFQKGMYYVPAMGGSFSIKSVLPALFPDDPSLDYHNLEGDVHNGGEAMNIFPKIKDMEPEEQQRARRSLLKYCELDTYAMVKVWQKLLEQ